MMSMLSIGFMGIPAAQLGWLALMALMALPGMKVGGRALDKLLSKMGLPDPEEEMAVKTLKAQKEATEAERSAQTQLRKETTLKEGNLLQAALAKGSQEARAQEVGGLLQPTSTGGASAFARSNLTLSDLMGMTF